MQDMLLPFGAFLLYHAVLPLVQSINAWSMASIIHKIIAQNTVPWIWHVDLWMVSMCVELRCLTVWLDGWMLNVEMVVPQLQPQEPKLNPPDGFGRETKRNHLMRVAFQMPWDALPVGTWAPNWKFGAEALVEFPKLRRVAHLFSSTRAHIVLGLLASSPMSASSSFQDMFNQRNERILVQNRSQDPSQDLTSKGKYFSRIFMAFWYLWVTGSQPKTAIITWCEEMRRPQSPPGPTLSSLSGGPVGPVRRTRSTRRGAHFLIGVFLQGLDLGQSISLGYVDPADLRCLERFQNVSKYVSKKYENVSTLSVLSFCGKFLGNVLCGFPVCHKLQYVTMWKSLGAMLPDATAHDLITDMVSIHIILALNKLIKLMPSWIEQRRSTQGRNKTGKHVCKYKRRKERNHENINDLDTEGGHFHKGLSTNDQRKAGGSSMQQVS